MKKLSAFIAAFCACISLCAFTRNDVKSYVLENGMHVYFLQDTQAAPVRIELNINAGFLNQTEKNGGFLELYANFLGLEMDGDIVRTVKTVAPGDVENTIRELTHIFDKLTVTDKELKNALAEKRNQIEEFASSPAGFINSAMDCKVFSSCPWQQQSGINPSAFNLISTAQARALLEETWQTYYTPENASIYISGNVTENTISSFTAKYLGTLGGRGKSSVFSKSGTNRLFEETSREKKFVLADDELSTELTQIVLQYDCFNSTEADMLSFAMDNDGGEFKRLLQKQKNLAIRAPQYINVSSFQTQKSSRLVIQSILEKAKANPVVQAELFMEIAKEPGRFSQEDFQYHAYNWSSYFEQIQDNSTLIMEQLARWNATHTRSSIFDRTTDFIGLNATNLEIKYLENTPFAFVLVNTATYAKYQKEFSKAGWVLLTAKTAPWYKQNKYTKFLKDTSKVTASLSDEDIKSSSSRFIAQSREQISSIKLANNIPVVVKHNPQSRTSAVCLTINGGELLFADSTPGLASVLTNCLAENIRRSLFAAQVTGWDVSSFTSAEYSSITITCPGDQTLAVIEAAQKAIIFGDITPALADGVTYDLRTQWRIKTGNPEFQLLCEAVRILYSKPYTNLFADTKDYPVQMEFTQIAAAYPVLLDSTRFSLIITGGTLPDETLTLTLNNTFGILATNTATQNIEKKVKKPAISKKTKKLQLRHQFFTDISADKAGPRPAVLIPTTDFSDPLLYIFDCPSPDTTDGALFNALLFELAERIQAKVSGEQVVKVATPSDDLPFAQVKITKIKHTAVTDRLYGEAVEELLQDLKNLTASKDLTVIDTEKDRLLATMENRWLMNTLSDTTSARGTAHLIQAGMVRKNPALYLDQYQAVSKASAEDYYILATAWLEKVPALRVYSADSKK